MSINVHQIQTNNVLLPISRMHMFQKKNFQKTFNTPEIHSFYKVKTHYFS